MGAAMRDASYRLGALYASLADEPFKHDFYLAMRMVDAFNGERPRLGYALRPSEDAVRLHQEPSMTFAPASISAFRFAGDSTTDRPSMSVRFFGFLGPNGALPLHLTEFAVQRVRQANDPTFVGFLNIFHHRWLSLFYRSWAQASPTVSLDRPNTDRFSSYVCSLIGYGQSELKQRSAVPDIAKQYFAGLLARQVRNAEGIAALLRSFFGVPVAIEQFVGHWMSLSERDLTRIGSNTAASQLGAGATLGKRVWDKQHKITVVLGPMSFLRFQDLLPTGTAGVRLRDWLIAYFGFDLLCDVRLVLERPEVPAAILGGGCQLGWSGWIGQRSEDPSRGDAADVVLGSVNFV
jgi:type VI secretion system protein ImpH